MLLNLVDLYLPWQDTKISEGPPELSKSSADIKHLSKLLRTSADGCVQCLAASVILTAISTLLLRSPATLSKRPFDDLFTTFKIYLKINENRRMQVINTSDLYILCDYILHQGFIVSFRAMFNSTTVKTTQNALFTRFHKVWSHLS